MPPRQHLRVTHPKAVPYQSSSCRIGTHFECAQSSPATAPIGIPVVYEACSCSCHTVADRGNRTDGPQ
ncbi:hypothetical protein DDE74_19100 [Streptomyces lydicus]|uniref:Uncharacterized protein n=1 Tax=Streptomyces lydicus TaxID=47763 RepID=A0A3Q9KAX6_9ACTN|nr:hypothetical protein DDE74_19100 [Streptomyces lydicus]